MNSIRYIMTHTPSNLKPWRVTVEIGEERPKQFNRAFPTRAKALTFMDTCTNLLKSRNQQTP